MTIDLDALRDALERECCGAFYGGGFGGAMVQMTEVQNASPEALIALAEEMGLDLRQFEIQER